jgi:anion transporter
MKTKYDHRRLYDIRLRAFGILSNTGTAVTLIPIVIGTCEAKGYNPIKHLAALGLACQTGGMIALPGTPPNVTVKSVLDNLNIGQTFGFFEYAKAGIPISIITILFVILLGNKLLPKKTELIKRAKSDEGVVYKKSHQIIVGITFIAVVVSMAMESITKVPLYVSSAVGAVFLMITRVVAPAEAFEEYVDWTTIMVIAGMLPLGTALQKSGAAQLIADGAVKVIGTSSSTVLFTLVIFIIGAFLTQFMSNTAATAVLAPIVVTITQAVGMSPKFALMALAMSASCSFATPMATPVNTVVMGYTGFSFNDFMKLGLPLIGIVGVFIIFWVPFVWA